MGTAGCPPVLDSLITSHLLLVACRYRLDFAFQWDEDTAGTDISGMNATLYQYVLPQVGELRQH
jgi:hypothetical protein